MASTPLDASRGEAKAPADDSAEAKAAPAPAGGGFKTWLPLIIAVVAMPALAFVTTKFVLIPQLQRSMGITKPGAAATGAPRLPRRRGCCRSRQGRRKAPPPTARPR